MLDAILKRLLQSGVVLVLMSVLAFVGINLVGDPVHLLVPQTASQEEVEQVRQQLGLDLPIPQQYLRFVGAALQGNLGESFVFGRPALELILERVPATLELAFAALGLSVLIGIPLGLIAGLHANGIVRRAVMGGSIVGVTVPAFWLGLLLILLFSVNLGWLPSGGRGEPGRLLGWSTSFASVDGLRHLVLPALTLSLFKIAIVIRLTEAGTREVMSQEYVRFARAKGVSGARLLWRHVLPNVLIPVVTAMGLEFGQLIAFSVVTETVFAWPGMGKLIIDSIIQLDRPVVVAYLLVTLLIFMTLNFIVDALYVVLDPRLRVKGK
ncbi:ABC transporter permease [Schlegelella sp. S2-27]|uniref:ABC transporter permease n=1 Tax=Caldimonas mangrovi TaxID=2944811 RepID=A0ABT0YN87_9BURK|nr:ABC transporter permease [Caldimonas mangrovi]MCM5680171.1 ABC transporter permease [Caldimonas mangrovi]